MEKKSSVQRVDLTARQQQDLDIEIGFLQGLLRRDPGFVEALQILGDDLTRRGHFSEGLRVDEQLVQLRPEDSLARYNLACSYALTDQFDRAFAALNLALDLGYRDFRWLARDPDLAKLRSLPAYKRIQARVRSLRQDTRS